MLKGQQGGGMVKGKTQQRSALPAGCSWEAPGDILEWFSLLEQRAAAYVFLEAAENKGFPPEFF